ncbi:MAG: type II toxin-antitoxin system PemK/MazF family toxin [Clostridia bacterium]|nr:type II toxin-antitoxin system PemK/MazF family toxin [Clostridia bacterium]MBQ2272318.1 type II toxin-antitoxin system PemK/MazF family toxin [Clostridia bacterium]MBQ5820058.1 type II toxin-antitoxin system PemK/MazF family toxin [Clostridia bacterium]
MSLIRRGDIYYADLSPVVGSEQGGIRPVLIIQNDVGNRHSPTVIAAAITSKINKNHLPTHIEVDARNYGLARDSIILLEQIRTLDKRRLKERMGHLDREAMDRVDRAISISFGLETSPLSNTEREA